LWTNFWRHKRTSWKSSSFGGAHTWFSISACCLAWRIDTNTRASSCLAH
jgi:hypothetical protein